MFKVKFHNKNNKTIKDIFSKMIPIFSFKKIIIKYKKINKLYKIMMIKKIKMIKFRVKTFNKNLEEVEFKVPENISIIMDLIL